MLEWPMVGRTQEMAQIAALLRKSSHGLVLVGVAGMGKTRLVTECLRLATDAELKVLHVVATPFTSSVPFGALASVLPHIESDAPAAARTKGGLLHHYAEALVNHADGDSFVLLVDDAHHLDASSAALVHQLAVTGSAFVFATVRIGEPTPSAITALWKDGVVERLELEAIPVGEIEELLASVLGGPVDRASANKLAARSEGNLLFLRELVSGALRDGSLRQDGGTWQLVGPLHPSQRLSELITERVGSLDEAERELLEIVALGEPIGTAELDIATRPAAAEVLEAKRLITSSINGLRMEIRLSHPLYGDVIRAQIPAQRRRKIARALAVAVEATGARRRTDILRVATWRLEGGGGDPDLMLAAATMARWRFAYPLAEKLVHAALTSGAGFDAELLLAQLQALQGFGDAAAATFAELAERATTDRERGLVAVNRLDNQAFQRGQLDDAIGIAEEAEAAISDRAWRDEIAARRTGILLATRSMTACADAARPLLKRASGGALAWAAWSGAFSLARIGHLREAREAAEVGYAAQLSLDPPLDWDPAIHISLRCDALAYSGEFELATRLATELYEQAIIDGNPDAQAFAGWHLGKSARECGNVDAAVRYEREAAGLFHRLGRPQQVEFCLTYEVLALALGGHADSAAEILRQIDKLELPETLYVAVDQVEARVWVEAAFGDIRAAVRRAREGIKFANSIGDLVGVSSLLHTMARLGHAGDALEDLQTVAARIEGELAATRVEHVRGIAESDGDALEQAAASFEEMGANLLAAEAVADAAVAWRMVGESRRATAAVRQAHVLRRRTGGARTPTLSTIDLQANLTQSERHIAALAARGRSNREIAEQLERSIRTIENSLQRIYEKLGISSRQELGRALNS